MIKEAIEKIEGLVQSAGKEVTLHQDREKIIYLDRWGGKHVVAKELVKKSVTYWSQADLVDGIVFRALNMIPDAFNAKGAPSFGFPISVLVNPGAKTVEVDFRRGDVGTDVAILFFRETGQMEALRILSSRWQTQDDVFNLLAIPLLGTVSDDLMDSLRQINLHKSAESTTEISVFGTKSKTGADLARVRIPSRKDGSPQETTFPLEWDFKIRPFYESPEEMTVKTRIRLLVESDGLKILFGIPDLAMDLYNFFDRARTEIEENLRGRLTGHDHPLVSVALGGIRT